jgi:hypothetical protein
MIAIAIALTAYGIAPQGSADDLIIVTSITVKRHDLSAADLSTAQRYARCLSRAFFPVQRDFRAKRESCRSGLGEHRSDRRVKLALDHIDQIVRNNPGSEASLHVVGKR